MGTEEFLKFIKSRFGILDGVCVTGGEPTLYPELYDFIRLINPLGEDTSVMRTVSLPSMLEILARNYNYRNKSARLYELGRTYFAKNDGSGLAHEPKVLSLGAFGEGMDFFARYLQEHNS